MRGIEAVSNGAAARMAFVLLSAMALAACARAPSPDLYMLDLPLRIEMTGIESGVAVGIGPLEFPHYLDRPQIITRDSTNHLHASSSHVWAEPIENGASRVLLVNLAAALESNRVYLLPRRVRTPFDWRVEIDIDRFDGALGGDIVLAARWRLYRSDARTPILTRVSIVEQPNAAQSYSGLVTAQSSALARLGSEIAAAIDAQDQQGREETSRAH